MITSIFKKSTFLNYTLVVLLLLFFFSFAQINQINTSKEVSSIVEKSIILVLLLASFFVVNFIVKKNGLTRNSSYAILFFLLFLVLFPSILNNLKLILANFFILLATRRIISLQTLKAPKEKIFDASLWIFFACLFHFWCILFLFIVYVSIVFHVSRDYRNWLVPFIAFGASAVIFILFSLLFDVTWISQIISQTQMNFQWDYFVNNYKKVALTIFALTSIYFVFSMIFTLGNKPLVLQASYKKMIFSFFVGIVIFLFSPEKSNAILVFTFLPLSVLCTNNIEYSHNKTYQEIVLFTVAIATITCFFFQL
ncbi:MAG TPA: DUF6427 family protein [Flavobacterium sp.]|jgi:hypothetical protein|nr:DUF6427 family protein [Flavobacterium sp.]HQW69942.1 DUF6427 family protein [Flavobacterium sp.]